MISQEFVDFLNSLEDVCVAVDSDHRLIFKNTVATGIWPDQRLLSEILPQDAIDLVATAHTSQPVVKKCSLGSMWISRISDVHVIRMKGADVLPSNLFQQITEQISDWLYLMEPNFRIIWANTPETKPLIGLDFHDAVPPEHHPSIDAAMATLKEGGSVPVGETPSMLGDKLHWFRTMWLPVKTDGKLSHVGVLVQDVTERHEQNDALIRSEARYRNVINNALDVVAVFNANYELQFVTPNVLELMGAESQEFVGKTIDDYLEEADRVQLQSKLRRLRLRPSHPISFEAPLRRPDGTRVFVEARIRAMDPGEDGTLYICNARDITARKELETMRQQLLRADKLAAVGQIAAGVAHEINNPASFIYTNLFVLRENLADLMRRNSECQQAIARGNFEHIRAETPQTLEILEDMLRMVDTNLQGMDRISHIVRELRMFSRDEADTIEFVDISEAVETSVRLVRNQIDHLAALEIKIPLELRGVFTDRAKLSQVLVNILVNATHAVADRPSHDHVVGICCEELGESVAIRISDTGPGMTPEVRARIFEPFFTTKPAEKGTGLGLWLCDDLLRRMGGRLDVQTTLGQGSTFSIILPRKHPNAEHPETTLDEASQTEYELRVLVVDDDELVLESMRKLLVGDGHTTATALGGRHALELLARDSHFDAIVSDVMMPDVDGSDLYNHISTHQPHLVDRIVFCTAGVATQSCREFLAQPGLRVLQKPVSATQLHDVLKQIASRAKKGRPSLDAL